MDTKQSNKQTIT